MPLLGLHPEQDDAPVAQRIRDEATDDWNDKVAVERLESKGGTFLRGEGRFVSPREVEVEGDRYEARRGVVIAAGGTPAVPSIRGLDQVSFWTNRGAMTRPKTR